MNYCKFTTEFGTTNLRFCMPWVFFFEFKPLKYSNHYSFFDNGNQLTLIIFRAYDNHDIFCEVNKIASLIQCKN